MRVEAALAFACLVAACATPHAPVGHQPAPEKAPAAAPTAALAIVGARVFDGTRLERGDTVVVEGGRIAKVGPGVRPPAGARIVDGRGDTLLPGLIDAHVHLRSVHSLKELAVFGVTTALDMGSVPGLIHHLKADVAGGDPDVADLRSAGNMVTAPGGHGTEYGIPVPVLRSEAGAAAFVDARIADGSDYIKLILEDGSELGVKIPTLDEAEARAVVAEAHRKGKLVVAHEGSLHEAQVAVDAGVDGLAHTFFDAPPGKDLVAAIRAKGMFVVPTLVVLAPVCGQGTGVRLLDDPHLGPYLGPVDRSRLLARLPLGAARGGYGVAAASVKTFHDAGIPILAGTDAPNPGTTSGASLHQELARLVAAGLSQTDALVAATSAPAKAFHLDDRGRIAPGLRADLVLVHGDPTRDITATRDIVAVWTQGKRVDRKAYLASVRALRHPGVSGLVSDFEGTEPKARFGAGWQVSTDALIGGVSTAKLAVVHPGAGGSQGALRVTGVVKAQAPSPWAGVILFPAARPMTPVDLSADGGIRFEVRGDGGTYRMMVFEGHLGPMPRVRTFKAGAAWRTVTLPFSAFGVDAKDVTAIALAAGPGPGAFSFEVDDVTLVPKGAQAGHGTAQGKQARRPARSP